LTRIVISNKALIGTALLVVPLDFLLAILLAFTFNAVAPRGGLLGSLWAMPPAIFSAGVLCGIMVVAVLAFSVNDDPSGKGSGIAACLLALALVILQVAWVWRDTQTWLDTARLDTWTAAAFTTTNSIYRN
jgi:hypothetical protein